jgi:hypothetical protein
MKNIIVCLFIFCASAVFAQSSAPTFSHIKYESGINNWLNIYQAVGKTSRPVVIWAHANGATAEKFPASLWQELSKLGVSVISWESEPELTAPEHVATGEKDFINVMDWVQKNAAKYNFDTNNIIISGRSRGTIISFLGANQLYKKIKGAYFTQALPNGGWRIRDFTKDVTVNSPAMTMAFADGFGSKDGHTPDNGLKIADKYKELGIGDRFQIYENLGKDGLYGHLVDFIKKNTN